MLNTVFHLVNVCVNECLELNGGCDLVVLTTKVHSVQCPYGLELINKTHCDTEIQCNVVQYIEREDYRFSCNGEYNLTVTNFTCEDIPKTSTRLPLQQHYHRVIVH